MKNETIKIQGLKCDNPKCNYIDMSIKLEDYEKYIDSKCPECGDILLTLADYINVQYLIEINELTNRYFPEHSDKKMKIKVEMNGTGEMVLNTIKIGENNG